MTFYPYVVNKIDRPFRYVLSMYPIDNFSYTLTKEQVEDNIKDFISLSNDRGAPPVWGDDVVSSDNEEDGSTKWSEIEYDINGFSTMDELENYVSEYVEVIDGNKPYTIRYIGIPPVKHANIPEIVAIAKVSKRGTTYVFSNNKEFLEFLNT